MKKSLTLYERDNEGELIPQEVTLSMSELDKKNHPQFVGEKICIVPLTRGELRKMFGVTGKDADVAVTDRDTDAELIVSNCKDPVYTLEEVGYARPVIVRSIVRTILEESGITVDETAGTRRIEEESDAFGKN